MGPSMRTLENANEIMVHNRRTAIERLNGRLKAFRKLDAVAFAR